MKTKYFLVALTLLALLALAGSVSAAASVPSNLQVGEQPGWPSGWQNVEVEVRLAKNPQSPISDANLVSQIQDVLKSGGTFGGYFLGSAEERKMVDVYYDDAAQTLRNTSGHGLRHRTVYAWSNNNWVESSHRVVYKDSPTRIHFVWFQREVSSLVASAAEAASVMAGGNRNNEAVVALLAAHRNFNFATNSAFVTITQIRHRLTFCEDRACSKRRYAMSLDEVTSQKAGGSAESYVVLELEVIRQGTTPHSNSNVAAFFNLGAQIRDRFGLVPLQESKYGGRIPSTFTVTNSGDTVQTDPAAFGPCFTYCALREAVIAANTNPGADSIKIPPIPAGMYKLTREGLNEDAAATGDLDIRDTVTIDGTGADVIVDGNKIDRVFDIMASAEVRLTLLTVRNGAFNSGARADGGGIRNAGNMVLNTVTISGNEGLDGGGISSTGTLYLNTSTVSGNRGRRGGGVWVESGGRVLSHFHTVIRDNSAVAGGGIAVQSGGRVTIYLTTIMGNTAREQGGGGISNHGDLVISGATIKDNSAEWTGGGIETVKKLTIQNSVVRANTAKQYGGGISDNGRGRLEIRNTTISDNVAAEAGSRFGGGGVATNGQLLVFNSTIVNNVVKDQSPIDGGSGGGILTYPPAAVELANVLVAGNTAFDGPDCYAPVESALKVVERSLIEDVSGCAFNPSPALVITCSAGTAHECPGLRDYTDDGQPGHGHYPLLPTSKAIDADSSSACMSTLDQLSKPRRDGNYDGVIACDIGAIEFQPPPPGGGNNFLRRNAWKKSIVTQGVALSEAGENLVISVTAEPARACWYQDIDVMAVGLQGQTARYEAEMSKDRDMKSARDFINPYIAMNVRDSEGRWLYNYGGIVSSRAASDGRWVAEIRDVRLPPNARTLRVLFCVWDATPGTAQGRNFQLRQVMSLLRPSPPSNMDLLEPDWNWEGLEEWSETWMEAGPDTPSMLPADTEEPMEAPAMDLELVVPPAHTDESGTTDTVLQPDLEILTPPLPQTEGATDLGGALHTWMPVIRN